MAAATDPENTLIIETTKGRVVIALRPDLAPKHVERIKKLAREGFYDGIPFHRVIEGFMAQTGCPNGTGTGGSSYPNLKAEFNAEPHVRGVCSMARAQSPDSANSQFFIVFDDATFLDKKYTVWGKVIEGMENVDKIKRGEPVQRPRQDGLGEGGGRRGVSRGAMEMADHDACRRRRHSSSMPGSPALPAWRSRRRAPTATALSALTPPAYFLLMHAAAALAIVRHRDARDASGRLPDCGADAPGGGLAVQRRHCRAHLLGHTACFPWRRPTGGSTMILGWLVLSAAGIWELLAHRG